MNPELLDTQVMKALNLTQEAQHKIRSEEVKRGMALKAEKGYHMNRVPIGYHLVWENGHTVIEPDPMQCVHVYQAFQRAATGQHSLRQLLQVMTKEGLAKNDGTPLSVPGLHTILTNPFYIGMIRHGGKTIPGVHRPLISQVTFDLVQQALQAKRRNGRA